MSNPAVKALRDKLSHLKSGRDNHVPVQDKSKVKDVDLPSMPNMKTPRVSSMAKSNDPVMQVGVPPPPAPSSTDQTGSSVMAMSSKDKPNPIHDLLKAYDSWKKSEETYKNKNLTKSKNKEEPLMKPFKSDAQRKAMYAAAEGESTIGIPKKVGKEFVSDSKDQDQSKLPERIEKSEHSAMCKSEEIKSALHCLCDSCRHSPELMRSLNMKCMCKGCCK